MCSVGVVGGIDFVGGGVCGGGGGGETVVDGRRTGRRDRRVRGDVRCCVGGVKCVFCVVDGVEW